MLLLGTSQKIRLSRRCAEAPSSRFLYASGFVTQILAHMLDSLVRVSRRVGTLHEPGLGDAQPATRCNNEHSDITKDPSVPPPQRAFGKNPSRCLTPRHRITVGIHPPQKANFPPYRYFAAPQSHQIGSSQFK